MSTFSPRASDKPFPVDLWPQYLYRQCCPCDLPIIIKWRRFYAITYITLKDGSLMASSCYDKLSSRLLQDIWRIKWLRNPSYLSVVLSITPPSLLTMSFSISDNGRNIKGKDTLLAWAFHAFWPAGCMNLLRSDLTVERVLVLCIAASSW